MFIYIETALIRLAFVSFYCFEQSRTYLYFPIVSQICTRVSDLHLCYKLLLLQIGIGVSNFSLVSNSHFYYKFAFIYVINLYPYCKLAHISNLRSCYKCALLFQICTNGTNSIRPYDTNLHPCSKNCTHVKKLHLSFKFALFFQFNICVTN